MRTRPAGEGKKENGGKLERDKGVGVGSGKEESNRGSMLGHGYSILLFVSLFVWKLFQSQSPGFLLVAALQYSGVGEEG